MYDNDEYAHGYYGSYYGSRGGNRPERWEDDYNYPRYGRQEPQQHRSPYGNMQDRYRYPQGQYQGGQYGSSNPYQGSNYDRNRSSQGSYNRPADSGRRNFQGYENDPWRHYHDDDGYAHGRPFVPEDRGWLDRTADEFRSWFGDDEAEQRRRMDRYEEDAYPRDYYGRRFRAERLREREEHLRAAAPYYGPPYGPNIGADF